MVALSPHPLMACCFPSLESLGICEISAHPLQRGLCSAVALPGGGKLAEPAPWKPERAHGVSGIQTLPTLPGASLPRS